MKSWRRCAVSRPRLASSFMPIFWRARALPRPPDMNQQFQTAIAKNETSSTALLAKLAEAARFIRCHSVASIFHAGSGHPGGALSSADLFACLYGAEMNVWSNAIHEPTRDRFVLSKGHAAPALYATGAHFGFCDAKAALGLRKLN